MKILTSTLIIALFLGECDLPAEIVAGPVTNSSNGHIYYLLAPTNAAAADLEAMSLGGHLATIRSIDENTWLLATFNPLSEMNNLFIGYTDRTAEGTFRWMSGETNVFTNWKSGEPNNISGNEDYVEIMATTGKWNDIPGASHYSVAEIPLRQTNGLPSLTIHHSNNASVELSWPSQHNQLYQILWANSLETNQWNTLGTYLYGTGAPLQTTDALDQSHKFYRTVPIQ